MPASKQKQKAKAKLPADSTLANSKENSGAGGLRDSSAPSTSPGRQALASTDLLDLPRQKMAKTPTKSRKTQANTQVASEPKRREQIKTKQPRAGKNSTSAKAKKPAKGKAKSNETSLRVLRKASAEVRVSFVVRVTVDEQGQVRRTEVEHVSSGKRENFQTLDVERMAIFMRACIGSPVQAESVNTTPPTLLRPETPIRQLAREMPGVVISEVETFRANMPGIVTVALKADEDFLIQVRFRLEGPDASAIAAHETSYQIKVIAQELTGGTSRLLATYRANLVKGVLEYANQAEAIGLPAGLYRLITRVTLLAPIYVAAHQERPIIQVSKAQVPDRAVSKSR